jgi:hypothetical protein
MTMSREDQPKAATINTATSGRPSGLWIVVGVIIAVPIVLPLLVGTYARTTPELGGVPFYFWWQFFLIIVSAVFTIVAYVLVLRLDRAHHERAWRDGAAHRRGFDSSSRDGDPS